MRVYSVSAEFKTAFLGDGLPLVDSTDDTLISAVRARVLTELGGRPGFMLFDSASETHILNTRIIALSKKRAQKKLRKILENIAVVEIIEVNA